MEKTKLLKSLFLVSIMTVYSFSLSAQATLPFSYDGGFATLPAGMTQTGLTADYSATPKLKFASTGNSLVLRFSSVPGVLTFNIKWNQSSAAARFPGSFTLLESADGTTYTTVQVYNSTSGSALTNGAVITESFNSLQPTTRYLKWVYTTKTNGNIAIGAIGLSAGLTNKLTISTQAASEVTSSTVTLNGNINAFDPSTAFVDSYGFCWNTTGTPTIVDNYVDKGYCSSTGTFAYSLINLIPNTKYYVRSYAKNTNGTSYGGEINFTTTTGLATILNPVVTSIFATTATINATLGSLGDTPITSHGFCWNTIGTPTISDSIIDKKTISSIGSFSYNLSNLSPSTKYYVRAFATNKAGTFYSDELTFTSLANLFSITVQVGLNGTIKENDTSLINGTILNVNTGTTKTFSIIPNSGYQITAVSYNGVDVYSQISNYQYTTPLVNTNSTFVVSFGNETKNINVPTAGTFSTLLSIIDKAIITNLTVTGNLDARDIKCMRDEMPVLTFLDLSGVNIRTYTGTLGTSVNQNTYLADEMPLRSFYFSSTLSGKISLKTIILPTSITSIGIYAFRSCTGISSITIPNLVTNIGSNAFYSCTALIDTLTIPNSVKTIGSYAFESCIGIKTLKLGSGITSISDYAFQNCSHIKSIYSFNSTPPIIPTNVFIGISAPVFVPNISVLMDYKLAIGWNTMPIIAPGLSVTDATITGLNYAPGATNSGQKFFIIAGSLLTDNVVISAPTNFELSTMSSTSFNPANSITLNPVDGVLFPDTIFVRLKLGLEINNYLGDIVLTSKGWPSNIISISGIVRAISETMNTPTAGTLKTLFLENELANIKKLSLTGNIDARDIQCMRDQMPLLSELDLSAVNIQSYSTYPANEMPAYSFFNPNTMVSKTSLKSILLPNSLASIGIYAFDGCSGLIGDLTIPNSVTSIRHLAFNGCSGLTGSLIISNSVTSIGDEAFNNCSGFNGNLILGNTLTSIGYKAFTGCSGLTGSLIIPNSVTSIGAYAFSGCNGFTGSLTIPNTITSIGNGAFNDCRGLTGSLIIPNSVTTIGAIAFNGCSGFSGSLTIPNTITSIGSLAFAGCSGLIKILTIPNTLTSISDYAFSGCGLKIINCLSAIPPTLSSNDPFGNIAIVFVPAAAIPAYKAASGWSAYTIASEKRVVINNPNAGSLAGTIVTAGYSPLSSITHLTVTGNLNSVDIGQMKTNMTLLTEIDLSGATLINNNLPANSFQDRTMLTSIKLPTSLTAIGDNAFSGCTSLLGDIPLPATVNSIGTNAFSNCSSLTGILTLPVGITTINNGTFSECVGLTGDLMIPNTVTSIGDGAFSRCIGFTGNLILPSSLTSIGAGAFYNCSGFSGGLIIPNSVTLIGDDSFSNCSFTGSLTVSNSATFIGSSAFYGCSGFTGSLEIPNSVTGIGNYTFYNCSGFSGSLNIPNYVKTIGNNAFQNCSGFTGALTLSNSITSIAASSFTNCSGITGLLTIPSSVTSIESDAYNGCTKLTELFISKNTTIINDNAFLNCTGLTKISVPIATPPTIFVNTFGGVNKEVCTLEVPIDASSNYQAANFWNSFIFLSEKVFETISSVKHPRFDTVKVYSNHSEIVVDGTSVGEIVKLYTVTGKLIQIIKSKGEKLKFSVNKNTVYFVKTGEKMVKVIF